MLTVSITPQFKRMFKKLESNLKEEAFDKIVQFKDPENHKKLKIHKLKGVHKNRYSFSVNYRIRIVFAYTNKHSVILTAIGSHDVYK